MEIRGSRPALLFLSFLALSVLSRAEAPAQADGAEVTIKGGLQCNGMCVPNPKAEDHLMVLFAVDGSPEIAARVKKIVDEYYPEKGLDAEAAEKLQNQFIAQLKYFVSPDSTAQVPDQNKKGAREHYCHASQPMALTGVVTEKDGRKWIKAVKVEHTGLKYPARMMAEDKPFAVSDREPLILNINGSLTLRCVGIPAGKAFLGEPFYVAIRYQEEYPRLVTLTRGFYVSEIPITQEIWEAVMGTNPSKVKDPKVPVQNPLFPDIDKFCQILAEKTHRKVRLLSGAEWEYVARVGTSNPGFPEKYRAQGILRDEGKKVAPPVKSKQPNAWGVYDLISPWWEVTGDKAKYPSRQAEVDPRYPAAGKENRTAMGVAGENWTISMREFDDETGLGYSSNKFRIAVDDDSGPAPSRPPKK
jgi:formylglycine-generating enzyme required for sulfatase activity